MGPGLKIEPNFRYSGLTLNFRYSGLTPLSGLAARDLLSLDRSRFPLRVGDSAVAAREPGHARGEDEGEDDDRDAEAEADALDEVAVRGREDRGLRRFVLVSDGFGRADLGHVGPRIRVADDRVGHFPSLVRV